MKKVLFYLALSVFFLVMGMCSVCVSCLDNGTSQEVPRHIDDAEWF